MDHKKRIDDFFEGKLTQQQAKELLDWMDTPEAEEYLSAEILQMWSEKTKTHRSEKWDPKPLWEKINTNKNHFPKPEILKESKATRKLFPLWLKAACVFLVLGISVVFLFELTDLKEISPEVVTVNQKRITKHNPAGQKTKIALPDGSTLFLNSESSVSYSEDFATNRHVELEGEGFFTVKKDENHPFTVEANGVVTTALGTSFNVSTFHADQKVAVTLVTGKVKLIPEGVDNYLILNPGEESVLSVRENAFDKYQVDVRDKILWTEGVLRFSNTTFEEMIGVLERWYGVKISVAGTPEEYLASGTFEKNESLNNVLHVLSASMDFEYQLNNKEVVINFN